MKFAARSSLNVLNGPRHLAMRAHNSSISAITIERFLDPRPFLLSQGPYSRVRLRRYLHHRFLDRLILTSWMKCCPGLEGLNCPVSD